MMMILISIVFIYLQLNYYIEIKMLKGQRIQINELCDGMTESISYQDDDINNLNQTIRMTTSKAHPLRVKNLPSLGINNISETFSIEEESCETQLKNQQKYKCFKCYGLKQLTINQTIRSACQECNGSQYISPDNGIASLLEKVLLSKYPHLFTKTNSSTTTIAKHYILKVPTTKSIEQQQPSQQMDNSNEQCNSCNQPLLPNTTTYICQTCPDYSICSSCFIHKKYFHYNHHKLILRSKQPKESLRIFSRYNNSVMKKISQQEPQHLEISNNLQENIDIKCDNCSQIIEQCYQSCLTCEKEGFRYTICALCSSAKSYRHFQHHELAMKTLPSKLNKIYSKSSIFQSSILSNSNNLQTRQDQPYNYNNQSQNFAPKNSIVNVFQDQQNCSIQIESSDLSLSNNGCKEYNFFDLFPKIDQSYCSSYQHQYQNKKSDVTPYEEFNDDFQSFNLNLFTTPRKSISPIKNQQTSKASTRVTRSPKKAIMEDDAPYLFQRPEQAKTCEKNIEFSTIFIDLEASADYQNRTKSPQSQISLRDSPPPALLSNLNGLKNLQGSIEYYLNAQQSKKQAPQSNLKSLKQSKILFNFQASLDESVQKLTQIKLKNQKPEMMSRTVIPSFDSFKLSPISQPWSHINHSFQQAYNNFDVLEPSISNTTPANMHKSFHQSSITTTNSPQEYIFDYTCDICPGNTPIKNKRYHCKQCQDFDLCQQCYEFKRDLHEHRQFEVIDGLELLKKQRISIMKLQQITNKIKNDRPRKSLMDLRKTTFSRINT